MKVSHVVVFPGQMPRVGFIVGDGPEIHDIPGADLLGAEASVSLTAGLRALGVKPCNVTLALPTAWCLAASIPTADLPARGRARLMLYRFEEQVPLAAEEMAVAFCPGSSDGHRLGIAVAAERVTSYVTALEAAGYSIIAIAPAAFLAIESVLSPATATALPPSGVVLWQDGADVELLGVDSAHRVTWWARCVSSADALLPHLLATPTDDANARVRCRAAVCEPELVMALRREARLAIEVTDGPTIGRAAVDMAVRLMARGAEPLVDLRTGPLAPRDPVRRVRVPLWAAVVASACVALSIAGACLYRAAAYRASAATDQRQLDDLYRQTLGKAPNGADVRARLASEERRLRGLSGDALSDGTRPPAAALASLRSVLAALPRQLRFRVLDLRVEPDVLQVEGQARTHGDADAVAAAVRRGGAFAVEAARTEARGDGQGVSFTLSGKPFQNGGMR